MTSRENKEDVSDPIGEKSQGVSRRYFFQTGVAAGAFTLAGCLGDDDAEPTPEDEGTEPNDVGEDHEDQFGDATISYRGNLIQGGNPEIYIEGEEGIDELEAVLEAPDGTVIDIDDIGDQGLRDTGEYNLEVSALLDGSEESETYEINVNPLEMNIDLLEISDELEQGGTTTLRYQIDHNVPDESPQTAVRINSAGGEHEIDDIIEDGEEFEVEIDYEDIIDSIDTNSNSITVEASLRGFEETKNTDISIEDPPHGNYDKLEEALGYMPDDSDWTFLDPDILNDDSMGQDSWGGRVRNSFAEEDHFYKWEEVCWIAQVASRNDSTVSIIKYKDGTDLDKLRTVYEADTTTEDQFGDGYLIQGNTGTYVDSNNGIFIRSHDPDRTKEASRLVNGNRRSKLDTFNLDESIFEDTETAMLASSTDIPNRQADVLEVYEKLGDNRFRGYFVDEDRDVTEAHYNKDDYDEGVELERDSSIDSIMDDYELGMVL